MNKIVKMKTLKTISFLILILLVMASFSQCSSSKKLQKKAPLTLDQVYYQKWIAGLEGGGAGLNIFIPTGDASIKLDSVYFRGKAAKLEVNNLNRTIYIGRFISDFNKKKDLIMSNEPNAEFGNVMPKIPQKIPFVLKDNECIISYKDGKITKYFKVNNVIEKNLIPYPSAPPNKQ
jgi:hypothetical protein